jgi:hypothetical protein
MLTVPTTTGASRPACSTVSDPAAETRTSLAYVFCNTLCAALLQLVLAAQLPLRQQAADAAVSACTVSSALAHHLPSERLPWTNRIPVAFQHP